MNIRWKVLLLKFTIWVVCEISLNLLGLDDIADYSEYVFDFNQEQMVMTVNHLSSYKDQVIMANNERISQNFFLIKDNTLI